MNDTTGITRKDDQHTIRFRTLGALNTALLQYSHNLPGSFEISSQKNTRLLLQRIMQETVNLQPARTTVWENNPTKYLDKLFFLVRLEKDNTFSLNVRDTYGANLPGINLADSLGLRIGYESCHINRPYPNDTERFAIPLADIRAIYAAWGEDFNSGAFLKALTTPEISECTPGYIERHVSPVRVIDAPQLTASIGLTRWRIVIPGDYKAYPGRDYGYRIENDNLTGPAQCFREGQYQDMGLELWIKPRQKPTFDPSIEQCIRNLGDSAEVAWKASLAGPKNKHSPACRPA